MIELNKKIRNSIANSYYLRNLAKDGKITQEKVNELYNKARENDKKILFYKNLSNALKEVENEETAKKHL